MKKLSSSLFGLATLVVLAMSFTSCENLTDDIMTRKAVSATLEAGVYVPEEVVEYCDITIRCKLNGKQIMCKPIGKKYNDATNVKTCFLGINEEKLPVPTTATVDIIMHIKKDVELPERINETFVTKIYGSYIFKDGDYRLATTNSPKAPSMWTMSKEEFIRRVKNGQYDVSITTGIPPMK